MAKTLSGMTSVFGPRCVIKNLEMGHHHTNRKLKFKKSNKQPNYSKLYK